MTEEEKKAIEDLKNILKYWQTIVDIEDDDEREIEMNCYSEEMPFEQLKIALNLIEKLKKENEEKTTIILAGAEKVKSLEKKIEELKNKVVKRDNEIIQLEESAEKEFLTKQEVKENYIPKDKIRKLAEELNKEIDWLFNEEGSWAYCEPFRNIAKKLEKNGR